MAMYCQTVGFFKVILVVLAAFLVGCQGNLQTASSPSPARYPCQETPMSTPPPDENTARLTTSWWSDGVIWAGVPPPGARWSAYSDGQKVGWWRSIDGKLKISGRRLDGPSAALQATIMPGYAESGFQSTHITIPTPGCWEITAQVRDHTFRFVVVT